MGGQVGVWQIAMMLVAAGAIYGGIRADLRALHDGTRRARRAARRAHKRLDKHISEDGRYGRRAGD